MLSASQSYCLWVCKLGLLLSHTLRVQMQSNNAVLFMTFNDVGLYLLDGIVGHCATLMPSYSMW